MSAEVSQKAQNPLDRALSALKSPILVVGGLSLFVNILAFVSPLFMLQVYDRVLTSRNPTTLAMLVVIAVVLLLSLGLIEKYRHEILVKAATRFNLMVAEPAFDGALQAALRNRGGQHAQVLRDVDSLKDFIAGHGILTLLDAPWVPVFMAVCFMFHPLIGLVAFLGGASLFVLAWLNDRVTHKYLVKASQLNIASYDGLSSALRNAHAIAGLGMAPALRKRWAKGHHEASEINVVANERGGGLLAVSKFIRMVLQIAILAAGAWLAIEQQISGGVLFASSLIMGKALAPLEQAVAQWKSFVSARSAKARLSRVFEIFPVAEKRLRLPDPKGDLRVEHVTIAVPGTQTLLVRDASFELRAGEICAIVGPTGSGKSTLARAIVGAWPIVGGAVRVDGNDLRHWDPDQIGASMGYLPQDVELFEGSVAENIARFGEVSDASVVSAAQMAQAHELIQRLPNGYETAVGDDGVGLSGGQRQRVGLARAIYGNPAILVLDEPNSNLDGDGDAALITALAAFKRAGKTVLVVTHKPNILSVVDKMLIMQGGQTHRFGPRDEILPLLLGPTPVRTAAAA